MANVLKYLSIPPHAVTRYHQRKVDDNDLKKFLRHVNNHFCELVFDCFVYGIIDGRSKQIKFGATRFAYTYDSSLRKIVLKTVMVSKKHLDK